MCDICSSLFGLQNKETFAIRNAGMYEISFNSAVHVCCCYSSVVCIHLASQTARINVSLPSFMHSFSFFAHLFNPHDMAILLLSSALSLSLTLPLLPLFVPLCSRDPWKQWLLLTVRFMLAGFSPGVFRWRRTLRPKHNAEMTHIRLA